MQPMRFGKDVDFPLGRGMYSGVRTVPPAAFPADVRIEKRGMLMKRHWWAIWLCLCWAVPVTAADTAPLRVGFAPLEPWKMEIGGKAQGAEIDLMNAIGEKLGMPVHFQMVPFLRCLRYMQVGELDMTMSLLRRPEREEYLHFIEPPYKTRSNKAFYVRKDSGVRIARYEDLAGLWIGTQRGYQYFPRFDQDESLRKDPADAKEANILKLLAGRIDALILTDSEGDYTLRVMGCEGRIVKAPFGYFEENPVYIGLSKASPLAARRNEIQEIVRRMVEQGEVDRIFQDYFQRHRLPLPQYK